MMMQRIEGLEKQVGQQAEINRQQAEVNHKLAETTRQQADVIEQLQLKLGTIEEEIATLKSSQALNDDISDGQIIEEDVTTTKHNANKQQSIKRALMGSDAVAFTAYVDHNLSHLGIDHTILYNKVILNEGGAYSNNTGIFTCPFDGIYVFNFMVAALQQQIVAKLVVDNVNMVDGIADTMHPYHEAQGGNYVTLSLRAGQSVWVATYRYADMGDYSSNAYRFSTFSGHLVSRNDGDVLAIQA